MSTGTGYIDHVKTGYEDDENRAWCGARLTCRDRAFLDAGHASRAALLGMRSLACPACVEAIAEAFAAAARGEPVIRRPLDASPAAANDAATRKATK